MKYKISIILLVILICIFSFSCSPQTTSTLIGKGNLLDVTFYASEMNYQSFNLSDGTIYFIHCGVYPFNNLKIGEYYELGKYPLTTRN